MIGDILMDIMEKQLEDGSLQYVNSTNDRENNITHLISNEPYARKVFPFIKSEYFLIFMIVLVFEEINKFVEKYNSLPTKETLRLVLIIVKI